jgi:hypothetical protein
MSPKSRKRKPRSKRGAPRRPSNPPKRAYSFEWVPSKFEGMAQEETDKRLVEIGEEHHVKYEESFGNLQKELLKWEPLYLLSASREKWD